MKPELTFEEIYETVKFAADSVFYEPEQGEVLHRLERLEEKLQEIIKRGDKLAYLTPTVERPPFVFEPEE